MLKKNFSKSYYFNINNKNSNNSEILKDLSELIEIKMPKNMMWRPN